ncbi:MAG: thiamine phosphate synthase [Candidatus Competibacteraceae bacterium]|nr:thiamine phosphate synthase [Candidatus Competibacteraceae bacterium]
MLDRFYPIVPDVQWLERLLAWGVKLVQLRIKEDSPASIRAQISRCLELAKRWDCQLIVNDYWQDAIDLKADFIHLGQEDLADADVAAIRRAGIKIGVSTHDEAELERGLSISPDYVALGPIYETTLKKMPWAPQGLPRLGEWKKRIVCPLVAIGGITLELAPAVYAAGADSIAVVTDIVKHADPQARTEQWLQQRLNWSR